MTQGPENPWQPDAVPALRPEDVPQGWGQGAPYDPRYDPRHGGQYAPYGPPKPPRGPASLVVTSTLSAGGAWVALLCLVIGTAILDEADRTTGVEAVGDFALGLLLVFVSLAGGGAALGGLVAGAFALPLAIRWFSGPDSSAGVTLAVVHMGLAWLLLLVGVGRALL